MRYYVAAIFTVDPTQYGEQDTDGAAHSIVVAGLRGETDLPSYDIAGTSTNQLRVTHADGSSPVSAMAKDAPELSKSSTKRD